MTTPIAQGPVDVNVSRHCCDLTKYPHAGYGEAVSYCEEHEDGTLWVDNSEYATQINFCPACGFPASVKVTANV